MTSLLIWREEWLLGIETLDADHQEMVRLMNLLFCRNAPERGGDAEHATPPVLDRLDAVIEHVRVHFGREESFLQSIDYPHYEEHRTEHSLQMAEFIQIRRELEESGAPCIDAETAEGIKRWFFNHAIAEDQRFADYYYEQLGNSRVR